MDTATLAILVDGLRHDFVTREYMPFLHSLAENGISGSLRPPLSFSLYPAWFAGLYPNESDMWGYYFSPETSPHRFIKPLIPILDRVVAIRKLCNLIISRLFYPYQTPALYFPLNLACYFDSNQKLPPWDPHYIPHTTLFDLLRKNGLQWLFVGPSYTSIVLKRFMEGVSEKYSFIWLYFSDVDHACHMYGPASKNVRQSLQTVDSAIKIAYNISKRIHSSINLIVFGDHGAVEVKRIVNIERLLGRLDVQAPRDFLYLLGATYAAFWFRNANSRRIITKALARLSCGRILCNSELMKYKLNFNHSRYGELLWVAEGGTIISPNFFNGPVVPKGMHGYLPDVKDNQSAFVLWSSNPNVRRVKMQVPRELVDIFPILVEMLNLEKIKETGAL